MSCTCIHCSYFDEEKPWCCAISSKDSRCVRCVDDVYYPGCTCSDLYHVRNLWVNELYKFGRECEFNIPFVHDLADAQRFFGIFEVLPPLRIRVCVDNMDIMYMKLYAIDRVPHVGIFRMVQPAGDCGYIERVKICHGTEACAALYAHKDFINTIISTMVEAMI